MKRRNKKQVRVAIIVALAATSITYSIGNLLAQSEDMISENTGIEALKSKGNVQNVEKAVGDVVIDETNFPDPVFREFIRTGSNFNTYVSYDSNGDGILSSDEIDNITWINVAGKNITSVQGIELFPNLHTLNCNNTGIVELDVSKNPALYQLYCRDTGITKLDVSNNPALVYLYCDDNIGLTSLNVSNNPALETLGCHNTGIIKLDISNSPALELLDLENTSLTSLDMSNNPVLRSLFAPGNNFAWLNIGDNQNLYVSIDDSNIDLGEVVGTFNITEVFPGINPDSITITSGASLDKVTGIVSGYTNGTPITYTYDCGTSMNGAETLSVTLHFNKKKQSSSIIVNDDLNKVYDGQVVAEPQVTVTGSTGAVTFEWYTVDGVELGSAPSEVGSYKLVVTVGEDSNYSGVTTEVVFMIKEAQPNNSSESNNKEEWNESIGNQVSGIQTGDITKVGLWILLVGLSIGLMLFFIKKNRKED